MLIRNLCSIAVYCQRCGKIHVQDIPYFSGTKLFAVHCDSCAHEQAVLLHLDAHHLEVSISCVVCHTQNKIVYPVRKLCRLQLEKIYCSKDQFELGYIGRRKRIEELLAFNQAEFAALHPENGKNFIEKQQILLEAMNRVHDIAARGNIHCPCGSKEIIAYIRGTSIIVECCQCGSYQVLRAQSARDLARLERGGVYIDLAQPGLRRKR